jgi:hypothetical protein
MFEAVYSLMEDVKQCLQLAEKLESPTLRSAIVTASHDALLSATDHLPRAEPKKRYILPVKPMTAKPLPPRPRANMPWAPTKTDLNAFRSEMLIFLREAFPERNPKANLAEVAYLWTMSKEAGSIEEIIKCAKAAVTSASEGRLRSLSEESV